jgi:hypothetical protein
MSTAKVISLGVRPLEASHLCFEANGILGTSHAHLGAVVKAFSYETLYATVSAFPTKPGDHSRLLYDVANLESELNPFLLATLRGEPAKAALAKAINGRQNAYFAKYANATEIIDLMNDYYSPKSTTGKPHRLGALSVLAEKQAAELKHAYTTTSRLGVVERTHSVLSSRTTSKGSEKGRGAEQEVATSGAGSVTLEPLAAGEASFAGEGAIGDNVSASLQDEASGETSTGSAKETQEIYNTDYGYRFPYAESQAQNERAQISLMDERFAQFMNGQSLPHMKQVFDNELNSIDNDVYRIQLAFLRTMLVSPISGRVTGIYKQPGEVVKAGEPIVRVENNSRLLLVARIVYRGPINLEVGVTVRTKLFDTSTAPTTISGKVVAVRGQGEDDQWEVVIECENPDVSGQPLLPAGYHFDYDNTTVSFA